MSDCEICGKVTELYHNEDTGMALCEACDNAQSAGTEPVQMFEMQLVNMNSGPHGVIGHRAGCRDIKRAARKGHEPLEPESHPTKHAAWLEYNADFLSEDPSGESAWAIHWMPCAHHFANN